MKIEPYEPQPIKPFCPVCFRAKERCVCPPPEHGYIAPHEQETKS